MILILQREKSTGRSTPGRLLIDGEEFCYTLEDKVREKWYPDGKLVPVSFWKIPGQTAIPSGEYALIVDYSSRFKKLLPHVLGVPGFDGIRFHGGNTEANTLGCILVGSERVSEDRIQNCAATVAALTEKIERVGTARLVVKPYAH